MRIFFLLLLALAAGSVSGLGRFVGSDGVVRVLGESTEGATTTFLFAPRWLDRPTWLLLPEGATGGRVDAAWAGGRMHLDLPTVHIPGVRYAVLVPARLLSLRLPTPPTRDRTIAASANRPAVTGRALVTQSATSLQVTLPAWRTPAGSSSEVILERTDPAPWALRASGPAASRTFRFSPGHRHWAFAPAAWGFEPTTLEVEGSAPSLAQVRVQAFPLPADVPADPTTFLNWNPAQWRQPGREWFAWSGTSVLVLITADYRIQDAYLKRLAFFVEKTGYRGRLVPDEELAPLHGWNAHDYAAPDLAEFFTKAARERFTLNGAELELRDRLVRAGILKPVGTESWEAGTGALVGVSAESPPALRTVLFVHEGFHGLYFTSPEFRSGVKSAWEAMDEGAREAFRSFLALSKYDPSFEALMVNEFQAYVLQRPEADWTAFFRDRVKAGRWVPQLLKAAKTLDGLVQTLYGLRSGMITGITVS